MRLLVFNGPNINMLGKRNPKIYGNKTYKDLKKELKDYSKQKQVKITFFQSNSESKMITYIQKHYNVFDGYIVNLGAYTHYSYAIRDAIELIEKRIIEVHISDINNREEFRKKSVIEDLCFERIIGEGIDGYKKAINLLVE